MISGVFGQRTGSLQAARFFFAVVLLLGGEPARVQSVQPEPESSFDPRPAVAGTSYMAVTANRHATDAALEILQLGGTAMDAAIAAQWVLNLVEPQSSGLGGGGFLLHWDAVRRRITAWDGRETAPRVTSADFARRADGRLESFTGMVASGRSVGVPGLLAMLEEAHRRQGRLKWERLVVPAIRLAENGFPVSPRLNLLLRQDPYLRADAAARTLYYRADGEPIPVGATLRNPELARMLRRVAREGGAALHRGATAERIVAAVAHRGGGITLGDLHGYRPRERMAVCGSFRHWRICGMPPPSSGGIGILQLLGILERSGLQAGDPRRPEAVHHFAEAGRLVYADRARFIGDPDFISVPQRELLADPYLKGRSRMIDAEKAMGSAPPGEPRAHQAHGDGDAPELPATTHLSIVDREGNAVALTSSIEAGFGSRIQVDGFLLNNQLTDFSFASERDGAPVANRADAGKRPMSSMAPTLVFDAKGRLHAVLGSPGGSRIINYVARTVLALLDGGMEPAAALAIGHVGNRNGATEVERGLVGIDLVRELERRGHAIEATEMTSGLHLIVRRGDRWVGAVDPRREGSAGGD